MKTDASGCWNGKTPPRSTPAWARWRRPTVRGIERALEGLGLNVPLFMSQNDGTLMDTAFAARFPALTISSGPTNSMRGAAHLTGVADGIVVDIGGTSHRRGRAGSRIPTGVGSGG